MKKKLSLFLTMPILFTPMASISCSNTEFENLKLNETFFGVEDYHKVGEIFNQKFTRTEIVNRETREEKKVTKSLWENFNAIEAKVTRVVDGDTIWFSVVKGSISDTQEKMFEPGTELRIRVPLTDTLEEYGDASEREKELAAYDSAFARSLLPVGTTVRLISDNWASGSYDRKVAYIFFGENFEKQFDIEMLANGYTMLRISESDFKSFVTDYNEEIKPVISSYLAYYAAKAFNDGYTKKRGFYRTEGHKVTINGKEETLKFKNPQQFSEVFDAHGSALISDAYRFLYPFNIEKQHRKLYNNPQNNIYEFLKTKQVVKK